MIKTHIKGKRNSGLPKQQQKQTTKAKGQNKLNGSYNGVSTYTKDIIKDGKRQEIEFSFESKLPNKYYNNQNHKRNNPVFYKLDNDIVKDVKTKNVAFALSQSLLAILTMIGKPETIYNGNAKHLKKQKGMKYKEIDSYLTIITPLTLRIDGVPMSQTLNSLKFNFVKKRMHRSTYRKLKTLIELAKDGQQSNEIVK